MGIANRTKGAPRMTCSRALKYFVPSLVSLALWTASTTPARAYLDPGTGSMILQVILGGVAGALVVLKLYWNRIKAFFGGKAKDRPHATGDSRNGRF